MAARPLIAEPPARPTSQAQGRHAASTKKGSSQPAALIRQVVLLALSRGLASLSQAILLLLLARTTNPSTFGLVGSILAVAGLMALADLGLQPLATRLYALPEDRQRALCAMYMQRVLLCTAAAAATITCAATALTGWLPWWILLTPIWACGERVALGDLNLHVATGTNGPQIIALSIMRFTALAYFAAYTYAFGGSADCFWIAMTLGALLAAAYTRSTLPAFSRPSKAERRELLAEARHFWYANIAAVIRNQDVALVSAFGGRSAAGLYSLPTRLATPFNLVMDALSTAALPIARRKEDQSMRTLYLLAGGAFLVSSVAGAFSVAFAQPLVIALAGEKFADASSVLRIVIIASLIALPETFFTRTLQAQGHEREISRIYGMMAALTLIATPFGASTGGAIGAAWSLLLIASIEFALLAHLIRQGRSNT